MQNYMYYRDSLITIIPKKIPIIPKDVFTQHFKKDTRINLTEKATPRAQPFSS